HRDPRCGSARGRRRDDIRRVAVVLSPRRAGRKLVEETVQTTLRSALLLALGLLVVVLIIFVFFFVLVMLFVMTFFVVLVFLVFVLVGNNGGVERDRRNRLPEQIAFIAKPDARDFVVRGGHDGHGLSARLQHDDSARCVGHQFLLIVGMRRT